jgi:DNA-directed RNA polymerase specialized sigma24 family protein
MGVQIRGLRSPGVSLDDLEWLYRSKGAAFERVAIALTGDEGLGCDAVQEAFLRAVRNRDRFRGSGTVEAWVWRIVINEAHRRRDAQRETPVSPDALDVGALSNGSGEDRALVRARIAQLPERQRLALFPSLLRRSRLRRDRRRARDQARDRRGDAQRRARTPGP